MKTRSWCAVAVALVLSTSASAQDPGSSETGGMSVDSMRQPGGLYDATPHTRKNQVSVWGLAGWWGIGAGARYTLPLVSDGLLAEINDSIELEFGADLLPISFWYGYATLDIPAEARWTFHVFPNLSLYAKLSLGLDLVFAPGGIIPHFLYNVGPGIIYRLGDTLVLRGEIGYRGLRAGIGFEF